MNNFDDTNQHPYERSQNDTPPRSTPLERFGFGGGPHPQHREHGQQGPRMGFGASFPGGDHEPRRGPGRGFGQPDEHPEWDGAGRPPFGPGFGGPGGPDMPGFGPRGGGRRGPGRGRKGDVRAAIIALLGEKSMNGYQLISAISEKSNGLWSPSAGSVYPALGLLEDEGLITPTEEGGKKLFRLTDEGQAYAAENAEQVAAPWERVAGPHKAMLDLRPELHQLGTAVQQLAVTGQSEQVEAARDILVKARQNIYRLLAGDIPQE